MRTSPVFQKQYKALNAEQKKAVDTIYGPVMVIAGPGTGKTTLLTLRIANILQKTDASASSILALTFTESAVSSMRTKLFEIIGTDAYRVHINTFHGFANDVISRYPEYFPRIIGSHHIRDIEQIKIVREIIERHTFTHIKPFGSPFHYVNDALKAIQSLKREGSTAEKFKALLENKEQQEDAVRYGRNTELAIVYEEYEKALTKNKSFDFDDMLLDVVTALKEHETLRATLQERFQYILADEHQDANASQNAILELLSSYDDTPNLLIVGDEKQAIFRFQGASLENFLYFKKRYHTAKLIFLTSNYRSGQSILDAAHGLISSGAMSHDIQKLRVPLQSARKGTSRVRVVTCGTDSEERAFLIHEIERVHAEGTPWEEIALIYRDNTDAHELATLLERTTIPFVIKSNVNVLENTHIHTLIQLFNLIHHVTDSMLLGEILFAPFLEIHSLDAYKALTYASIKRIPLSTVLSSKKYLTDAGIEESAHILNSFSKILSWSQRGRTRPFIEVFDSVVRESNFIASVIRAPGSADTLKALEVLFQEVKTLSTGVGMYKLSDFLEHIAIMEEHGSTLKMLPDTGLVSAVTLMTAHRAKGLEFEHVYITDVVDGHWGNRKKRSLFTVPSLIETSDDDERRLLYVALTRAKKEVVLTFPKTDMSGSPKTPSQFIEELDARVVVRETTDTTARILQDITKKLSFAEPIAVGLDIAEKEFLNRLFSEQGFSVSALNNYLSCPWKYFFVNLLRIPTAPSSPQRFGTMLHMTLRLLGEREASGKKVTHMYLQKSIHKAALQSAISEREEELFVHKGMHVIEKFWNTHKPTHPRLSLWEHSVRAVLPLPQAHHVELRGVIDRVDMHTGGDSVVSVVDYKTGKPKSRNEIEGKTKNSNGDYFRQLVFYRLILSLEGLYTARQGALIFVEPDTKGVFRNELFELTDAHVQELTQTIARVAEEIRELSFWNSTCTERSCQYCTLGKMITHKKHPA
ncbi:ATP-dependent helicase [Candidatus Campbellbacteria bacterium]|nr:MAG: ATP-dependent helicase [Candidatus Campbellbacteria bacterium]